MRSLILSALVGLVALPASAGAQSPCAQGRCPAPAGIVLAPRVIKQEVVTKRVVAAPAVLETRTTTRVRVRAARPLRIRGASCPTGGCR